MNELYSVKRGATTVVAKVAEHKGVSFLDIRAWVEKDGALVPTKKGVTVPLSCVADLAQALAKVGSPVVPEKGAR